MTPLASLSSPFLSRPLLSRKLCFNSYQAPAEGGAFLGRDWEGGWSALSLKGLPASKPQGHWLVTLIHISEDNLRAIFMEGEPPSKASGEASGLRVRSRCCHFGLCKEELVVRR